MEIQLAWFIALLYLVVMSALNSPEFHLRLITEELFISAPIIALLIGCAYSIKQRCFFATRYERPIDGCINLCLYFMLGELLSILLNYSNSDVRGWWPFALFLYVLYAIAFSALYGVISWIGSLSYHHYNSFFALTTLCVLCLLSWLPYYTMIPGIGDVSTYTLALILLLGVHCISVSMYTVCRLWVRD